MVKVWPAATVRQQKAPPSRLDGAEREEKLRGQCDASRGSVIPSAVSRCYDEPARRYHPSPLPRGHRLSVGPDPSATRPCVALQTVQGRPLRRIPDEDPRQARPNLLRAGIVPITSHVGNGALAVGTLTLAWSHFDSWGWVVVRPSVWSCSTGDTRRDLHAALVGTVGLH